MPGGISCKYIPTRSGGPALRFFSNDEDAIYSLLRNLSSNLFPNIRKQISRNQGNETIVPQPVLPGLESYLSDEVAQIKEYEQEHQRQSSIKASSSKLERFVINRT